MLWCSQLIFSGYGQERKWMKLVDVTSSLPSSWCWQARYKEEVGYYPEPIRRNETPTRLAWVSYIFCRRISHETFRKTERQRQISKGDAIPSVLNCYLVCVHFWQLAFSFQCLRSAFCHLLLFLQFCDSYYFSVLALSYLTLPLQCYGIFNKISMCFEYMYRYAFHNTNVSNL